MRIRVRDLTAALLLVPAVACGPSGVSASPKDGGVASDVGALAHEGGQDVSVPFCSNDPPSETCTAANIHASSYDQTCQTDSDCILVVDGYACASCAVCAPLSAINRSAISQYAADVAKIVAPAKAGGGCAPCCGPVQLACCQGGLCHADTSCSSDAGAE
jgi:hypothetical protein